MKIPKPRFELARVYADGTQEVEIVPITDIPLDTTTGRRGFLATALTAAAVLGSTAHAYGVTSKENTKTKSQPAAHIFDCGGLVAHAEAIYALTISSDGSTLASCSADETIKLWDLTTGTLREPSEPRTMSGNLSSALAISPDGHTLASGDTDGISLTKLPLGEFRRRLLGHTKAIGALAISPDGSTLASGSADRTIKLWDLTTGTLRLTLAGHINSVDALAITSDSRLLVSGGKDNMIKLWELPSGKQLRTLEAHTDTIGALAISPDGSTLASGSADRTIKLWDLTTGTLRLTLAGHINSVDALAITSDSRLLVSGGKDKMIKLWELLSGNTLWTIKRHTGSISALVISPDSKTIVSGSTDKTIKLTHLPSGEFKACLIDLSASSSNTKGITYQGRNENGLLVTYTLPCGSPIPPDTTCTCNCVPGTYAEPSPPNRNTTFHGGAYCYCNPVCTCNKVCTCVPVCQAHRLRHDDLMVRTMAEEILFIMGSKEFDYMQWAARQTTLSLKQRIFYVMAAINEGAKPNLARWPSPKILEEYLGHTDSVIALMAAQLLHHWTHHALTLADDLEIRVSKTLAAGQAMNWRLRAH